jgi:hypothetical protein
MIANQHYKSPIYDGNKKKSSVKIHRILHGNDPSCMTQKEQSKAGKIREGICLALYHHA